MSTESTTTNVGSAADKIIQRTQALFSPTLNRAAVLGLSVKQPTRVTRLHVIRNHAVEHAFSALPALLSPWNVGVDCTFGTYDDSLLFDALPTESPLVLWMDFSRLTSDGSFESLLPWFHSRLVALRAMTDATIVVVGGLTAAGNAWPITSLSACIDGLTDVHALDLTPIIKQIGPNRVYDRRAEAFSGTPFSSGFMLQVARALAAGPLAHALGLGIKAVVCDLDNTLYDGVLAEDEVSGLLLSPARRRIQERLLALRQRGILLAVLSRNLAEDVDALFAERSDFVLQRRDFAVIDASWGSKAEGFGRIISQLKIGADASLFLDDNLGELLDVAAYWPETHLAPAHDPETLLNLLSAYPGIEGFCQTRNRETELRTADLQTAKERALLTAESPETYFKSLGVSLDFQLDSAATCERLSELSSKTNQFNLTLARLPLARVRDLSEAHDGFVLSVSLRDRLSDSGIIAGWCGHIQANTLITDDLVISCRALGRRLEELLLAAAFRFVAEAHGASRIVLPWATGPRNQPALRWIASLVGAEPKTTPITISVPAMPKISAYVDLTFNRHAKQH